MGKIFIISDNNSKSRKIKNQLEKNKIKNPFKKKDLIIVIGGDGFMLKTLKKKNKKNVFFYGINSGNFGFLMNKFLSKRLLKNFEKKKHVVIHPLSVVASNKNNIVKKFLAINEVSVLRQSKQTSSLRVFNKSKILIKKLVSDGLLVSTPAGSTAYNLSVSGPILKLDSKKISVAPISPFRPRRWPAKILNDNSIITIINLNAKKRPISAVADNHEFRNVNRVKIQMNKKIKFNLLYEKNYSLQNKIKYEKIIKRK